MEWSKDKTLKLIELLQRNPTLWNASLCETRRDKQLQKRKEELRSIAELLGVFVPDITKKIQHLRTQYNRESVKEARVNAEDPNDRYVSNWYAYEYMHFMKDSTKHYRIIQPDEHTTELNNSLHSHTNNPECKLLNLSPSQKRSRNDLALTKSEITYPLVSTNRDEFSVFGEYVANELRSLKGEKNLLVAKKKIQDVIFEVKMGMICEARTENAPVYSHNGVQGGKIFTTPVINATDHIEPMTSHTPPTSGISEIIINGACHYTNFKVDSQ